MYNSSAIQIAVGRVLTASSAVFGHVVSLCDLSNEARRRNANKETREKIAYLQVVISDPSNADLGVVVSICDNLTEKLEQNRFSGVTGFAWIEGLTSSLTDPAKKLVGWTVTVACTSLASLIVFNVGLSKLPMFELWTYTAALIVLVGTASTTAAWASSIGNDNGTKKAAVLLGYSYVIAYAYALYRCDLSGFNFNYPMFGDHWMIVWMTVAPIIGPLILALWKFLPEDGQINTAEQDDTDSIGGTLYYNHDAQKMGKIGLDLDPRLDKD